MVPDVSEDGESSKQTLWGSLRCYCLQDSCCAATAQFPDLLWSPVRKRAALTRHVGLVLSAYLDKKLNAFSAFCLRYLI